MGVMSYEFMVKLHTLLFTSVASKIRDRDSIPEFIRKVYEKKLSILKNYQI